MPEEPSTTPCPKCGTSIEQNNKDYYRCGVRSCRYKMPAPGGIMRDNVIECPECSNDTLILSKVHSETCPNPRCDYTKSFTRKGGSCYVATAAIPDRPASIWRLRAHRNRRLAGPIGTQLLRVYYSAQPHLEGVRIAPVTRTLIISSVSSLDKSKKGRLPALLWELNASLLFVSAFVTHLITSAALFLGRLVQR